VVDAVGHDAEPVAPPERPQYGAAAGQAVTAAGESLEVGGAEAGGPRRITPDLAEQPAKALPGQRRLGDLSAAKGRPQLVVDALVGGERRGREAKPERAQRQPQRGSLGSIEVEQRPVDVEEDGAEAGQGPTWRGR